mmetsp:Transcript_48770/g.139501  ORF Transcript_48770/g.139501 Transcript_48770/m.139501 type:complete len:394 (-) Transcript_48770:177-1358(-)|eukprot:CAMPEP_0168388470 /NCGR_PEP_ID=MMETSP0228-20121227/16468_1 /TAXON_ID=133427 /ORGANISM="Protoceratium reticulatum, Strain CCCM 535 (=CCMP 1889)" /LENGTH=393 /DNA_ID=CAMNT_0008401719 /DNA_START=101 /DNA_END=1282 /DNA_ORIENTATION=-
MASIIHVLALLLCFSKDIEAIRRMKTDIQLFESLDSEQFLKMANQTARITTKLAQMGHAAGVPQNWKKTFEEGVELSKAAPAMLEKMAKITKDNWLGPASTAAIVSDLLALVVGAAHAHDELACPLASTLVNLISWIVSGAIFISQALPEDFDKKGAIVSEKLTESFTSVGYGGWSGDLTKTLLLKFAHAMHTWVGTALINGYISSWVGLLMTCAGKVMGRAFDKYPRYPIDVLKFVVIVLISTGLGMSVDFDDDDDGGSTFWESLYFILMTGSSVGYGDLYPRRKDNAALGTAVLWMPLLTVAFDRFKSAGEGDPQGNQTSKELGQSLQSWTCAKKSWFDRVVKKCSADTTTGDSVELADVTAVEASNAAMEGSQEAAGRADGEGPPVASDD